MGDRHTRAEPSCPLKAKIGSTFQFQQVSTELEKRVIKKLDVINFVTKIDQLRIPPGNRLEKLSGDLTSFYSVRINDQFRIIFKWINDHAYEVQLTHMIKHWNRILNLFVISVIFVVKKKIFRGNAVIPYKEHKSHNKKII